MSRHKPYLALKYFVLRTPLFSLDTLNSFKIGEEINDELLKEFCNQQVFKESIFLASPSLYDTMEKWLNGEAFLNKKGQKKLEKLREGLLKYILRMTTRCTPFGKFAGFNTGEFSESTNVLLDEVCSNKYHTRFDMNYLVALAQNLSKKEEIQDKLLFYPNTSIYTIGHQLRYIEYHYVKTRRVHQICAVDNSIYIQRVIGLAKEGAKLLDLTNSIIDDEISSEEANAFIISLIESQILICELEPTVSGDEFLKQIIHVLKKIDRDEELSHILSVLLKVERLLVELENKQFEDELLVYKEIKIELDKLDTKYEAKFLFQSDFVKPAKECKLNQEIADDVLSLVPFLAKMVEKNPDSNLKKFKDAFYKRYEDAEMPLLQALDTETGVGYIQNVVGDASPLIKDLFIPVKSNQQNTYNWSKLNKILLEKYNHALKEKLPYVEFFDEDVKDIDMGEDDFPISMAAMIQIVTPGNEVDKPLMHLKSMGGSSGVNLIGRFCHADKNTLKIAKEICHFEERMNEGVVFAEICHLPESRTGNVLLRPSLRKYEIPYLSLSTLNEEYQILPDDLFVSIKGERIILRSKKLNKEVIPRNSTAHNFSSGSLPVYHFLCDLQTQNLRGGLYFNWGQLINSFGFLPRVVYKNFILSLATWNIKKEDLKTILEKAGKEDITEEFKSYLIQLGVPYEILLSDGDNELYIDLRNKTLVRLLFDQIKKRPAFQLKEFVFNADDALVKGPGGSYTNEFILPIHKNTILK